MKKPNPGVTAYYSMTALKCPGRHKPNCVLLIHRCYTDSCQWFDNLTVQKIDSDQKQDWGRYPDKIQFIERDSSILKFLFIDALLNQHSSIFYTNSTFIFVQLLPFFKLLIVCSIVGDWACLNSLEMLPLHDSDQKPSWHYNHVKRDMIKTRTCTIIVFINTFSTLSLSDAAHSMWHPTC